MRLYLSDYDQVFTLDNSVSNLTFNWTRRDSSVYTSGLLVESQLYESSIAWCASTTGSVLQSLSRFIGLLKKFDGSSIYPLEPHSFKHFVSANPNLR